MISDKDPLILQTEYKGHHIEIRYSSFVRELVVYVPTGEYKSKFNRPSRSVTSRIPFISCPIDRLERIAEDTAEDVKEMIREYAAEGKLEEISQKGESEGVRFCVGLRIRALLNGCCKGIRPYSAEDW